MATPTGLLILLSAVGITTACTCTRVQIYGHEEEFGGAYGAVLRPAMGIFEKSSFTVYNGKPVYEQVDGSYVIYWWPDHDQWYVGLSSYSGDILTMSRVDKVDTGCPHDGGLPSEWTIKYWANGDWQDSVNLYSQCVTDCACSSLRVAGVEMVDPSTSGTYTKMAGVTKHGWPVWKKDGANYYLYYHLDDTKARWRLGTAYDGSAIAIASGYAPLGTADYCAATTVDWQAWENDAWSWVGMSILCENALGSGSCGCDTVDVSATNLDTSMEGQYIRLPGVHSP